MLAGDGDTLSETIRFGDRETRVQALATVARRRYERVDEELLAALLLAAEDRDPLVREWVIVALRSLGTLPRVLDALWSLFHTDDRDNIRAYAISALGDLGRCVSGDDLLSLFEARRAAPGDILLPAVMRGFGQAADSMDALLLLHGLLRTLERGAGPLDARMRTVCQAALLRCAKNGIERDRIRREDLRDVSWKPLLERLGERRIEQRIKAERARRDQASLFAPSAPVDDEFTPSSPLSDNDRERYLEDVSLWENLHFAEVRLYHRDRALARQRKEESGWRCMVCGRAGTSVDAHHIQPRSEHGPDTGENIVVLCPNCHRDTHDHKLTFVIREDGAVAIALDDQIVTLPPPGDRAAALACANARLARRLIEEFRTLDADVQKQVVEELFRILHGDATDTTSSS
jgi:hypothetical protein